MNEVSNIHLGRQAFTISAEAYQSLKRYLDAIKKQVADADVVAEIELRMAELLSEHGVSGEKVVLAGDVDFLKQQLGNPQDFKADINETTIPTDKDKTPDTKRLFRDTEHGMIAGVAAGLSQYTGLDVVLIRILFVIAVFTGGWGILLYLVLWLLAPEAKTSSDRLQMAGKPVTVDSLKEIVERADVRGAARRANNSLAGPINSFFRFMLKLIGVGFIVAGLSALFGLIAAETYLLLHGNSLQQDNVFPIGVKEHLLLHLALVVAGIITIFIVLFGLAMFRRKWPIRTWITGVLIGLVFIGLVAGGALTADVVPTVHDRYNANVHTSVRHVEPFTKIDSAVNGNVSVLYQASDTYSVGLRYFDRPNLSTIKTTVKDGTLFINAQRFDWSRNCHTLCLPNSYNMVITVYSPNLPVAPPAPAMPAIPAQPPRDGSRLYQQ